MINTAFILGCGPSIENFIKLDYSKNEILTFGINHVNMLLPQDKQVDYLYAQDQKTEFIKDSQEKYNVVLQSDPVKFFAIDPEWNIHPKFERIYKCDDNRGDLYSWQQWDQMPFSITSALTPCIIAVHVICKEQYGISIFERNMQPEKYPIHIIIAGVDLYSHYYFGIPKNKNILNTVLLHFEALRYKFEHAGIKLYRLYDSMNRSALQELVELRVWGK